MKQVVAEPAQGIEQVSIYLSGEGGNSAEVCVLSQSWREAHRPGYMQQLTLSLSTRRKEACTVLLLFIYLFVSQAWSYNHVKHMEKKNFKEK